MDRAVGGEDVGDDDLGVIGHDLAHIYRNLNGFPLQSGYRTGLEHLGGGQIFCNDMVEQDVSQAGDVIQQSRDRAIGQQIESVIGGGEDREGTFPLEGIHQVGSGQGSRERIEAPVRQGCLDDILVGRQDDTVDDVNDTIGSLNIGQDDLGVIDEDLAVLNRDLDILAEGSFSAGQADDIGGSEFTGDNMVEQDVGQQG